MAKKTFPAASIYKQLNDLHRQLKSYIRPAEVLAASLAPSMKLMEIRFRLGLTVATAII